MSIDTTAETETIKLFTAAMREADKAFQRMGGGTRNYVMDCLLPALEKHDLKIVRSDTKE